jgi:lactate dehydrogenase-like 2-hydroxyacid dehydrogenase
MAENLKLLVFAGVGYASFIDLGYCKKRGITVGYCPGANANAVAEFSTALLTAALKDIVIFNNEVKRGIWNRRFTADIFDKTIGFIGFGHIGQRMAQILHLGYGCRISYHARTAKPELDKRYDTQNRELYEVLKEADVLVACASLTDETRGLIGTKAVEAMKDGVYLMNVARAELVDTEAVLAGLASGKIGKYVTDVYHKDPVSPDLARDYAPLYPGDDKLILSPHPSWMTADSFRRMKLSAVDTAVKFFAGVKTEGIVDWQGEP